MSYSPPIVIGYPRTGFTLLINVISDIYSLAKISPSVRKALEAFCDGAGMQISASIENVFERRNLSADLLYSHNFKQMVGGPKWLREENNHLACFRKYIGVRGKGDFTLFTSHPREVLDYYEVIHSHADPALWVDLSTYVDHQFFASIRHPAGTVASACFSLNALCSEYIQRFIPTDRDNDLVRQQLALYKLSDLNFFEALLKPYQTYLEEFDTCADRYFTTRWEDLIQNPLKTIESVANVLGVWLELGQAADIWARIDHVNLTGAHKHNFRQGYGIVGDWKNWLTNTHLDLIRDYGLDKLSRRYGYDVIDSLDEAAYTPFQKKLADAIANGDIIHEYDDEDLFGFAFNKSNLDLSRFAFKHYEWRKHTRIERSSCLDDGLVMEVWDAAEDACGTINKALDYWFCNVAKGSHAQKKAVETIAPELIPLFPNSEALAQWKSAMFSAIDGDEFNAASDTDSVVIPTPSTPVEPELLLSVGSMNIVVFQEKFFGLPQSLGVIDFFGQNNVSDIPGVEVADELSELLSKLTEELT